MIRGLLQSMVLRLPSGLASLFFGWKARLALLLAASLAVAGLAGWAYTKGRAAGMAASEAVAARNEALRQRAEIEAAKDADLVAAAVQAETARERGPAEVLDRLGKGTF